MLASSRSCALWAALTLAMPASAVANQPVSAVVVVSPDTARQHWVRSVSEALAMNLRYPLEIGRPAAEGLVTVTFRCGQDGRPTDIAVPGTSGSDKLDLAAERAVAKLRLHPLPSGVEEEQLFVASVVFSTDSKQAQKLLRKARQSPALAFAGQSRRIAIALAATSD